MRSGGIELLNIDCMDYLSTVPDKFFDLAIVDPPYGIGEGSAKIHTRHHSQKKYKPKEWDNESPPPEYFDLLQRKSKNQIIWGANHFIDNIPFNVSSPCWIVWDKDGFGDQADCEIAWTSFKTAIRKYKFTWNGFRKELPQERIHPTEKPYSLYKWIFSNYVNDGDKIIDTHGGSMSIACAAHDYKVNITVCEKDTEIYNDAVKRFSNHIAQTSLF
jgi:site-specific DNA-methyltransferase (adenine-specific)